MNSQANKQGGSVEMVAVFIACAIVLGLIIFTLAKDHPKSPAQLTSECVKKAGQVYDLERQLIAEKNPDRSTHQYYYQQVSDDYTRALASCNGGN